MQRSKTKFFMLMLIILLTICSFSLTSCKQQPNPDDYIRIHIRANSNDPFDQEVKLRVRDAIVQYLSHINDGIKDKAKMLELMKTQKSELKAIADKTLSQYSVDYSSSVEINREFFDEKKYSDSLTLPNGDYDALIIKLGKGAGNNWWCIAYPPLCFVGGEKDGSDTIQYKSIIKELIERFFK